LALGSLHRA